MDRRILSCDLHDHLEIACVYALEVELTLKDGSHLVGTPITTRANSDAGEFLDVKDSQTELIQPVPVLSIVTMQATRPNPHFDRLEFMRH